MPRNLLGTCVSVSILLCLPAGASLASVPAKEAGAGCKVLGEASVDDGDLFVADSAKGKYAQISDSELKFSGKTAHLVFVVRPIGEAKPGAVIVRHRKQVPTGGTSAEYADTVYVRRKPMNADMKVRLPSFKSYHENGAGSRTLAKHFHVDYGDGNRGSSRTDDTPLKLLAAQLQEAEASSEDMITKRLLIPFQQHTLATCIDFRLSVGNTERTLISIERIDAYDLDRVPAQAGAERTVRQLTIEMSGAAADGQ